MADREPASSSDGRLLERLAWRLDSGAGLAWIAGTFAARLAPERMRRRWPVRTLVAAAVLFNPAFFGVSAIWGQVDSVPGLFVLSSLLLLLTGERSVPRDAGALLLFSVALAIKPQVAFVDRKSTRLNSSHRCISYAVFCL